MAETADDHSTRDDLTLAESHMLIGAAAAAPSMHNAQPWRFDVRGRWIDLWLDGSRRLGVLDPDDRNLHLGAGAALFNLRVAGEHLARAPEWDLLPDPARPELLATVRFEPVERPGPLAAHYRAISTRRTNRRPFTGEPLPRSVIADLVRAAVSEGAWLRVSRQPREVDRIVRLLRQAELAAPRDAGRAAARSRWLGTDAAEPDGIPIEALGPHPARPWAAFRDLDPRVRGRGTAAFESTPTLGVLSTRGDGPAEWLRAGQALQRILLVATDAGVSASFLNQPLEDRELRWAVRSPFEGPHVAQMVLRLGRGPAVPPTPRRPLDDLLGRTQMD
jgi:hypothetical protein